MSKLLAWLLGVLLATLSCTNNPYPSADSDKKILYQPFTEAPKTLDPAVAYSVNEHEITGKVMDTLLEYHYLKRPYELIPGLATKVPEPQPLDGTRVQYRFELRRDLLFQDDPCFALSGSGKTRQITSEDFAFELMRIADPRVASPADQSFVLIEGFRDFGKRLARKLGTSAAGGHDHGEDHDAHDDQTGSPAADPEFEKLNIREQYLAVGGIEGIRTPDPLTLEIVLEEPYPQILYWFAMPFTTPVPWEAVEYYDGKEGRPPLADHPVGSGPYVLTSYEKQSHMVLDKNPNWYGARHPEDKAPGTVYPSEGEPGDSAEILAAAGKPLPFIDRIEMRREKEAIPRFGKFLQGYYDASAIITESFDMVVQQDALSPEMQELGMSLEKSVVPDIYYLGFNMADPKVGLPGGDRSRKLRQAMSLAVDVREYTRVFANGRGIPAQSPLPPGIFGYDADYQNPYRAKVDIERAKQLLADAGYPGGVDPDTGKPLRISFDTPSTSPSALLRYKFFVRGWRQLGLDVIVDATSYNQFQDKMRRNAYQLFMWGWVADYPDPENFLFLLWSKSAPHPNSSKFKNARFDELFLEMKARPNDPARHATIREMVSIIEHERPWIELFHSESYTLFHSWLHNVKPAGLSIQLAKYRDLDPEERAKKRDEWNEPVMWPLFALLLAFVAVVTPGVRTFFRERQ